MCLHAGFNHIHGDSLFEISPELSNRKEFSSRGANGQVHQISAAAAAIWASYAA